MSSAKQSGFTLVELMVVIVVVGILTMVAVPTYQQSVIKSRRADGKILLNDTAQRLERCYTQFGTYDNVGCAITDAEVIPSPEGFYQVTVTVPDATSYSLDAAPLGPQVSDTKCGSLSLNNVGVRGISTLEPIDHCW